MTDLPWWLWMLMGAAVPCVLGAVWWIMVTLATQNEASSNHNFGATIATTWLALAATLITFIVYGVQSMIGGGS